MLILNALFLCFTISYNFNPLIFNHFFIKIYNSSIITNKYCIKNLNNQIFFKQTFFLENRTRRNRGSINFARSRISFHDILNFPNITKRQNIIDVVNLTDLHGAMTIYGLRLII